MSGVEQKRRVRELLQDLGFLPPEPPKTPTQWATETVEAMQQAAIRKGGEG